MANDGFSVYRYWLEQNQKADKQEDIQYAQNSFESTLKNSAAYQNNVLRNGKKQPMVVNRTATNKCKIILDIGGEINIGDLVYIFNEYWICVEKRIDEYGMTYGEIWMCNILFKYQKHDLTIVTKHAIIDDGSYSKGSDKPIPVTDGNYTCYISLDEESKELFVDKRLAIDIVLNSKGEEILEVGKIIWLDTKSKNFGEGSHLLVFGLSDDVYSKEYDNLELIICDYKESVQQDNSTGSKKVEGKLEISGRDTIRIGTGRTYTAKIIDSIGNSVEPAEELVWICKNTTDGITIENKGNSCLVKVALEDKLIGTNFVLECIDKSGNNLSGNKEVAVISIG